MQAVHLFLLWYPIFLFSTTLHEAAHAFAAQKGGDLTAYNAGLVTFDPLVHIRREPFGMVLMPLLSFALSGWLVGWASVPFDPLWAARERRRAALMSLAGPLANLLLAVIAGVAVRIGCAVGVFVAPSHIAFTTITQATSDSWAIAATALSIVFSLNLLLFVFNLLPVPPLDGSGVLTGLLPRASAERYRALVSHGQGGFLGLMAAWLVFDRIFEPIFLWSIGALYPGLGYL